MFHLSNLGAFSSGGTEWIILWYLDNWRSKIISKSNNPLSQIEILIQEVSCRYYSHDYYSYLLKKLQIIFSTTIKAPKNKALVEKYRNALVAEIELSESAGILKTQLGQSGVQRDTSQWDMGQWHHIFQDQGLCGIPLHYYRLILPKGSGIPSFPQMQHSFGDSHIQRCVSGAGQPHRFDFS